MITAIYPGTFDPITLGHIDVIQRAMKIFPKLTLAIAKDNHKNSIFTPQKRTQMAQNAMKEMNFAVEVVMFDGLLVDFMQKQKASVIIRGLRAISDFEYEFQMSCMNTRLNNEIETVFLPAKDDMHFVSSRMIRSVAELGGNISQFVPKSVEVELMKYFAKKIPLK